MSKQIILDILIVLGIPLAIVIGYLYFSSGAGTNLLSYVSNGSASLPGAGSAELGAKTKVALAELNSINFDKTLFNDPIFLTLEDFSVPIIPSPLGREYPFTSTAELQAIKRSSIQTTNIPAGSIRIPVGATISQKLDAVKSGAR